MDSVDALSEAQTTHQCPKCGAAGSIFHAFQYPTRVTSFLTCVRCEHRWVVSAPVESGKSGGSDD